jgi:fructose-1,6-bisphosphatase/inositol monophosphatase family enzyme
MTPDIDAVTRLIREIVDEEVVPRFGRLAEGEVSEKAPGDYVTIADLETERRLSEALPRLLPGSLVVGEEAAAADLSVLRRVTEDRPVWVIDPVDGTWNFAEGRQHFATMVALVRADRVAAAWIHDPLSRETATAEAGGGAWLGSRRLQVAAADTPLRMQGALLAGSFGDPKLIARVRDRRGRVGAIKSLRSAAHEYLRLVRAETHFALFTKLMPWDHSAGVLIHAEAGGHARYLDGAAYRPSRTTAPGLLLAPDEASWRAIEQALLDE